MHTDQVPLDVQSWETAMSTELKHWQEGHFWFSKFESVAEHRPLQRSQLSRLCYIHAPVVIISYLQRFYGQQGVKMINIMEWMRSSFPPHMLNRHIFGNTGSDSKNILKILISQNRFAFHLLWFLIDEDTFDKHGPALVARFEVYNSKEILSILTKMYRLTKIKFFKLLSSEMSFLSTC